MRWMIEYPRTRETAVSGAVLAAMLVAGCQASTRASLVPPSVLAAHDYSLANTPNKRTALAYLYTAWNDGKLQEARQTYWVPGVFRSAPPMKPPPGMGARPMTVRYTVKKVIEEGDQVVVLAFVEGVGIGEPITTLFGTPGGTKVGDAVVEIFQFRKDGLIARKWDTIEPLSEATYDFR